MNPTISHPRYALGRFPTPLHRLRRLEAVLGGGQLLLKRDDLAGFSLAGNKTRPLEFLLGDALSGGCDIIVGGGAPKSNFVAALASAARSAGIECELLIAGRELDHPPTPIRLARACGAVLRFTGADREQLDGEIEARTQELASQGRHAYAIPRGGACAVGALGFANAAFELVQQEAPPNATIVLPVGSAASIAGLLAGGAAAGATWEVLGISVSRPVDEVREHAVSLALECSRMMSTPTPLNPVLVDATDPGMSGVSDEEHRDAVRAYEAEGLFFDPSYGVKALHYALSMVRSGVTDPVVLWHTGGLASAIGLIADRGRS